MRINSGYILCKSDQSISLPDLLSKVHKHGAIDLAVLLRSAQHLLSSLNDEYTKTVEKAGYLLSQ